MFGSRPSSRHPGLRRSYTLSDAVFSGVIGSKNNMPHTVGLLGATGNLGTRLLPELVKLHSKGTIRLIILYREASKLPELPYTVETRLINPGANPSDVVRSIVGINIFV